MQFLFIAQHEAEHGVLLRVRICLHILLYWFNMVFISSAHHFQKADVAQPFLEFCKINSLNGLVSGPGKIN